MKSHENGLQGDEPNVCGPQRTPESYKSAVGDLQTEIDPDVQGIKVDSGCYALKSFHVCKPGLPPYLGHDIFKGVISYDAAVYFKCFNNKKEMVYRFTFKLENQTVQVQNVLGFL